MKIVCISDTHGNHEILTGFIPEDTDVLIHAGDMTSIGGEAAYKAFVEWFRAQNARHKVLIAGNHDLYADEFRHILEDGGIHYLHDSGITIEGVRFYGSPWTPWFHGKKWAYNFPEADEGASAKATWELIPEDTDVLVTHGPPFGVFDVNSTGDRVGCPYLAERIVALPAVKLHVFGHVHEGYGMNPYSTPMYVNAAMPKVVDGRHYFEPRKGIMVNLPVIVEI